MEPIGIIHNPFAKGNLKNPKVAPKVQKLVEDVGIFRETLNVEELPTVAQEFKDQGIKTIAVNGGDGTLHMVLTAFVNVYKDTPLPKLMSLRGGTMNTMSNSLKIKGKTLGILKQTVDKLKSGHPFHEMQQHLVKVNQQYGFLSGGGTIAKFLDAYYSGSSTGPWRATQMVAGMVGSTIARTKFSKDLFSTTPMKITVEGTELDPDDFTFFLACSVKELGLGFKATPRAYDKPDHFHLVATSIKPISMVPMVPSIWLGRDIVHPEVQFTGPTNEFVVEPKDKMRYMIDGELYDTEEPLHYSAGPTITVVKS